MSGTVGDEHRPILTGFMKLLPVLTGVVRIVVEYHQNLSVYPLLWYPHAAVGPFLCHGRGKADTVFNRICGISCVTPVTAAASRDSRGALVDLSNGSSGALS